MNGYNVNILKEIIYETILPLNCFDKYIHITLRKSTFVVLFHNANHRCPLNKKKKTPFRTIPILLMT